MMSSPSLSFSSSNDSYEIIRSGWIEKKYSHTYKRRYLQLTSSLLSTFLEDPLASLCPLNTPPITHQQQHEKKPESCLSLSSITEINLFQDSNHLQSGIGYFEIVIQATKIRFRCCFDEASLWVRDIKAGIPHGRQSLYQEATSKPKSTSKVTTFLRTLNISSPEPSVTYVPPVVFTFEQADALQRCNRSRTFLTYSRFFDFMSSSTDICVGLIISVFESINRLEKSERGKAARQVRTFQLFESFSSLVILLQCGLVKHQMRRPMSGEHLMPLLRIEDDRVRWKCSLSGWK
jgi:hypothetical protein